MKLLGISLQKFQNRKHILTNIININKNISGPSTVVHCSTPDLTDTHPDVVPSIATRCFLIVSQEAIQEWVWL